MIIPINGHSEVIEQLKLNLISDTYKLDQPIEYEWNPELNVSENTIIRNIDKVIAYTVSEKWCLFESKILYYIPDIIGKLLSKNRHLYIFHIDVWTEAMRYSFYYNGVKQRSYEYKVVDNKAIIHEEGEILDFEEVTLSSMDLSLDNEYLLYPLLIMNYFGVKFENLEKAIDKNTRLYCIENKFVKHAKEVALYDLK